VVFADQVIKKGFIQTLEPVYLIEQKGETQKRQGSDYSKLDRKKIKKATFLGEFTIEDHSKDYWINFEVDSEAEHESREIEPFHLKKQKCEEEQESDDHI
jgi:hypothetical protein